MLPGISRPKEGEGQDRRLSARDQRESREGSDCADRRRCRDDTIQLTRAG